MAGGLHRYPELVGLICVGDRDGARPQRAQSLQQLGGSLVAERGGQRDYHAVGLEGPEQRRERADPPGIGGRHRWRVEQQQTLVVARGAGFAPGAGR